MCWPRMSRADDLLINIIYLINMNKTKIPPCGNSGITMKKIVCTVTTTAWWERSLLRKKYNYIPIAPYVARFKLINCCSARDRFGGRSSETGQMAPLARGLLITSFFHYRLFTIVVYSRVIRHRNIDWGVRTR